MVDFKIKIHVGFNSTAIDAGTISISPADVEFVGTFAGSRHIHEMGRHFHDYVESTAPLGSLLLSAFGNQQFFTPLRTKERAPDVTGNIGESVAGIVAQRSFGLSDDQICHLQIRHGMSTPDYALQFQGLYPPLLTTYLPPLCVAVTPPQWIPTESKAVAKSADLNTRVNDAFRQLVSYWEQVKHSRADIDAVGFGLIVCMKYLDEPNGDDRAIRIHVFIPKSRSVFLKHIQSSRRKRLLNKPHSQRKLIGMFHDSIK